MGLEISYSRSLALHMVNVVLIAGTANYSRINPRARNKY